MLMRTFPDNLMQNITSFQSKYFVFDLTIIKYYALQVLLHSFLLFTFTVGININ